MRLYYKFHSEKIYRLFKTDFWIFESSIWLHVFGRSMISIFVPILLLKTGYSISQVMFYHFLFNIFDFPLNFFAKFLTHRFGAVRVIMLGTVSYIVFFVMLLGLQPGRWLLFVCMALFMALYDTFYWVAHLFFFMECSPHKANITRDTSFLYIIKKIAGMLAPLIGAVILIFSSQKILIFVSILILLFSLYPLFKIKGIKDKPKGKPENIFHFFKHRKDIKDYIIMSLYSFHNVGEEVMWPMFIYVIFKSIESVAIIPIIVSLTTIIFTYFTGKIKQAERGKLLTLAAVLISITWLMRIMFQNEIFYYISVVMIGLFSILFTLPLDSNIFEQGERKNALAASAYRNVFSMFPRIFFYGILILLLEVFHTSFISASIAMFAIVIINSLFVITNKKKNIPLKPV